MKFLEGKTPKERNQIIVLAVVGTLALLAVGYNFSGLFFGGKSKTSIQVNVSPTATPTAAQNARQNPTMPTQNEVFFEYTTTPVYYNPSSFNAPGPGRNIFAFYEPPKPTPYSPTPPPPPTPFPQPTPSPTPPILLRGVTPGNVFAGSPGFTLQVRGDRLSEDSVILFNGNRLMTTFVESQGLVFAEVPAQLIAAAGNREISVFTPDGKFSNTQYLNVQQPPKPDFEYIGMIGRKLNNNDTAYFQVRGREDPTGARLNDVIGTFRLMSISPLEVIFEDVNLGFRHKLPLKKTDDSGGSSSGPVRRDPRISPPTIQTDPLPEGEIPGIPSNIPRYTPPTPTPDDDKDDEDGEDNN